MKIRSSLFVAFCMVLASNMIFAQTIFINEYSASNLKSYLDDYGKYEDWIELYNSSENEVDISGWFLSDNVNKADKWSFPDGTIIPGKAFFVVWCSGREEIAGTQIHTSFKISQTGGDENIVLSDPSKNVVDQVNIEITGKAHSRCRSVDGAGSWKIATIPTLKKSNLQGSQYKRYASKPVISLAAGFYKGEQSVTIETTEPDGITRYTLDGNEPQINSLEYISGTVFSISETKVLKAKTFSDDAQILPSQIDFKTYFIDEEFTLPVFSVAADNMKELANGNGSLRPEGSLEYFDQDGNLISTSYGELNRHGQDSWALNHRSIDWISRDEMGYSKAVEANLFSYSDRNEFQRFMFRASGDDNYPAIEDAAHEGSCHIRDEYVHALAKNGNMKLDVRASARVVVFFNGEYWGVYGLRERPADHDYTEYYYDQDKYNLHFLATWGGTWAEYGENAAFDDWAEIRDFILENDMSVEENYEVAKDRIQLTSLCDYMIINLNTVASDWLNYNTGWWRGLNPKGDHKKWGYILWDNDATFDYYINYSGVPNTDPDAKPCDIDEISNYMDEFFNNNDVGKHEKIFLKLIEESDEFRQLYYSRQADMINTVFSCENMISTFDSMIAIIAPEMPRQIERWGGSMDEWSANVDKMKDFIEDRCTLIDDGMVECFNLTGPYNVTLNVEPVGSGSINFNTLKINDFPWSGDYFGEMPNLIEAKTENPSYQFLYWKSDANNLISPDSSFVEAEYWVGDEDELTAVFGPLVYTEDFKNGISAAIYPTVIDQEFVLDLILEQNEDLKISLLDMSGTIIDDFSTYQKNYSSGKSKQIIRINNAISNGMYIVTLESATFKKSFKIIKVK